MAQRTQRGGARHDGQFPKLRRETEHYGSVGPGYRAWSSHRGRALRNYRDRRWWEPFDVDDINADTRLGRVAHRGNQKHAACTRDAVEVRLGQRAF